MLYAVTLVGLIFVAVWCSDAGEAHYKRHDVGNIVIDEFAGFFVTMFLVPTNVRTLALAFSTEDMQEGVKAFFEKREPQWTGR